MSFNPYYYSQDFLDTIDKMKIRVQYAKIILLTFDEQPIKEIQGTITSGSLSINGASAVRRSINLSMSVDKSVSNITDLENLIALNKKVRVEVGFDTPVQYIAKRGEKITWFKQGIYVIASASISESTTGYNISLTGNDKMVMLNGVAGGTIPFTTILSEKDEITEDGQLLTTDTNLFQIIQEVVTHFGKEPLSNVIINDIIDTGKIYVKYIGNDTYHVYFNQNGVPITGSVGAYQGTKGDWKEKTYQNGQVVGYFETDLTWPDSENNPLQASAGETVTSVLDKIKNVLGNYEYFYDLDGRFVFQQIQNWLNTTSKNIEILTFDYTNYLKDYSKMPAQYMLSDKEQIISISQNPKFDNIKNDFVVIGKHTSTNGLEKPIMYHVAIDKKPLVNSQLLGTIEMKEITYEYLIDDTGNALNTRKEVSMNTQRWLCYSEDREKWYDFQGKPIKNSQGEFLNKESINDLIQFNINATVPPVKVTELLESYQTREVVTEVNYESNNKRRIVTVTTKLYTAPAGSGNNSSSNYKEWPSIIESKTQVIGEFQKTDSFYFNTRNMRPDEWREVMYQRAMIESRKGSRSSDYDEELLGFWRDVYNPGNPTWDKYGGYCTNLNNLTIDDVVEIGDYTSLVYWLDLIEPGAPLSSYSVSAIGRRTKTETDDKITSIYNQAPEDIVYCFNTSELQNSKNNNVFLLKQAWQPMFTEASVNESCFDRVRTLIYNHFTYNTAISLSMTPRFYMEPNTLIELDLEDIKGKFQLTQINLPLGYSGTMSLSLIETNQRG